MLKVLISTNKFVLIQPAIEARRLSGQGGYGVIEHCCRGIFVLKSPWTVLPPTIAACPGPGECYGVPAHLERSSWPTRRQSAERQG